MFKSISSVLFILHCSFLLFPQKSFSQIVDFKLTAISTPTPYISFFKAGFGAEVDLTLSDKINANLKYGLVTSNLPFYVDSEIGNIDSGEKLITDKNNIFELNLLYSILGSRNSKHCTKIGAGVSYQKSKTKYLSTVQAVDGEITLLIESSVSSSSNRYSLSLVQQFNLNSKIHLSIGITTYVLSSTDYPVFTSASSSTFENNTSSTSIVTIGAPYNDLMYSFSIGYRIFEIK